MILLTFKGQDGCRLGVKTDRGIVDVWAAAAALGVSGFPGDTVAVEVGPLDRLTTSIGQSV